DILRGPGERDEGWAAGCAVPRRGWPLDVDAFYNQTRNAVDHEVLGNSNLLFPLTIESGRVRAFESTPRWPRRRNRLQWHYAFSLMRAQGRGAITGGRSDLSPPPNR